MSVSNLRTPASLLGRTLAIQEERIEALEEKIRELQMDRETLFWTLNDLVAQMKTIRQGTNATSVGEPKTPTATESTSGTSCAGGVKVRRCIECGEPCSGAHCSETCRERTKTRVVVQHENI